MGGLPTRVRPRTVNSRSFRSHGRQFEIEVQSPDVAMRNPNSSVPRDFDKMKALNYFPLLMLVACSADPIPSGRYIVNTGQETDTLTMAPAPETFTLSSVDSSTYKPTVISTSDKPIDSIDVGITGSNFFMVQGEDLDGVRRVQATSYAINATQLAGYDVPLFLGRTDAFCRPPGNLSTTGQGNHPPVGIFWGQTLWMAGGGSINQIVSEGYDLVSWAPSTPPSVIQTMTCPSLPCQFRSIANYIGEFGLGIGSDWAVSVDITLQTTAAVDASTATKGGMSSWLEVSGGRTIDAITGASYVVGPTRGDTASSMVLELNTKGDLIAQPLSTPRQQAAAAYINTNASHGLLVVGGSLNGAGAEFLDDSGTAFVALPYPADSVVGAALLAEPTGSRVWRVGGMNSPTDPTPAPTLVYDLTCKTDCTPEPLPAYDLVVTNAIGFSFGTTGGTDSDGGVVIDDRRVVIGELDDGTMVAWRVTTTGATPIPVREPRKYATVLSLPNGFAALIGGTLISNGNPATSIELVAF